MKISWKWRILFSWLIISLIVFTITGETNLVIFTLTFGGLYGGTIYHFRNGIRQFFETRNLNMFPVFLLVSILVSVVEELYVYSLGNQVAVPNIWRDIIIVPGEWTIWFSVWYLYTARKYSFTDEEALFSAGLIGLLYEYIGKGIPLSNPVGFILAIPGTVVIYAAIFILPMQLVNFQGENNNFMKYPVSILLPYILTIPAALLLYALFY